MKSAVSYLFSLIVSVMLVFTLIGAVGSLTANININEDKFHTLAADNDLSGKTRAQLDKYFSSRYNSTGIPADVYMDAIDEAYLDRVINEYIDSGFNALRTGNDISVNVSNKKLEGSIDQFFVESADSANAKIDDRFEQKLDATKESAYAVIMEYCDAYKFNSLKKHGVLDKLTPLFNRLDLIVIAFTVASALLMLLLLVINIKSKPVTMFWIGVSSLITGIIAGVPSGFILATRYFERFTIKQPQVYTAYTSVMKQYTNAFLSAAICGAAAGICFVIVYRTVISKNKTVAPTRV